MNRVNSDSLVDLFFHLKWKSPLASHTDCFAARRVNIWRDILPARLEADLMGKWIGDRVETTFPTARSPWPLDPGKIIRIGENQFEGPSGTGPGAPMEPRAGRFYPKGYLGGVSGIFRENMEPFRLVKVDERHLEVDLNHSLAGREVSVVAFVGRVETKEEERGGTCVDMMEAVSMGPGMQARINGAATDFFSDEPFVRADETPDALFYGKPRFTRHLDDTAIEIVTELYGGYLEGGSRVLDLMASWESHIPEGVEPERLTGLGLNARELERNPRLSDYRVHDLNAQPTLPFGDGTFDLVICTVSVEYLTDPVGIFREVGRILKPEGMFITTFSNRWFPQKAIRIWEELHEFERMGLVCEYFIRSGVFDRIRTYSVRGLPRPVSDAYYPRLLLSDPVYAVSGQKI